MGQDDLIRLDNVTKTYQAGTPPALADLSIETRRPGRWRRSWGPSGSGR